MFPIKASELWIPFKFGSCVTEYSAYFILCQTIHGEGDIQFASDALPPNHMIGVGRRLAIADILIMELLLLVSLFPTCSVFSFFLSLGDNGVNGLC